jgi:type I restriction enzyme, S subunit
MRSGAIDFETCTRITPGAFRSLKATGCVIRSGDVLLSKDGTVGRVVVYEDDREVGALSSICLITPRNEHSSRFIGHALQSHGCVTQFECLMSGSALRRLVLRDIREIAVPSPPKSEQEAIARILDTLDTTIRQTEAIIEKLKQVKQGLLHDLLTRGIDANGELRPPQSDAPHLYKRSPFGWIPSVWTVQTGRSLCSEITVGIVVKPTQYYRLEGVPMLRSANVRESGMTLHDLVFMSERDHRMQRKSSVRPGDVLTVRTGYPGTSCVVDEQVVEANCIDIIISRPGPALDAAFWSVWINSSFGAGQVLREQGGLAQQHFNVGALAAMQVAAPDVEEQREIVSRLRTLVMRIDAESSNCAGLRKLKSGLMDDLLTGRVRVTPLLEAATA